MQHDETVNVRYMVDDVEASIDFYTRHLGFSVRTSFAPAFADVTRGNLRLLLSGPTSSAPSSRSPSRFSSARCRSSSARRSRT